MPSNLAQFNLTPHQRKKKKDTSPQSPLGNPTQKDAKILKKDLMTLCVDRKEKAIVNGILNGIPTAAKNMKIVRTLENIKKIAVQLQ